MQECTGRYTFDSGIALQFAMFILQKPAWKALMNTVPPLHELTKAVQEYYRFAMCPPRDYNNDSIIMLMTNVVGFKVNDPKDQNAQSLIFLFYKTLAEFYEHNVIPFYVHLSHVHNQVC
jgi:hypothetical protein